MLKHKVLLITGGTGSFGNAVLERFLRTDIKEIRIFSRDEAKQEEMRRRINNSKVRFYIGDVRVYESVNNAMNGVNYVFHAAALKQVPSCEFFPMEAVRTNVLGSENVMNAAIANHVERFVGLSTDKAVYPINAMGITKSMMEKIIVAKARMYSDSKTVFCATRYGNVMVSRGSVIPMFVSQIEAGQEITVTDPDMTRFLMSLEESVDLVMHALKNARQGDIFVQKAPATTIAVLVQALQDLFGTNNPIRIIGTRHGEKLDECLASREELSVAENMGKFYRIPADNRTLNYDQFFVDGDTKISTLSDYTSRNTERLNCEDVKKLMLQLPFIKNKLAHSRTGEAHKKTIQKKHEFEYAS